jgi:hypothetical protein
MKSKLETLAEIEGMDVMEMLEQATFDSVALGICMKTDCNYTCTVEPDQSKGYCGECDTQTVKSCLVLAGAI